MTQDDQYRPGTRVAPVTRLDAQRLDAIHAASMAILDDPGIVCFNERAADAFAAAGCPVTRDETEGAWRVRLPQHVVMDAVESAPSQVVLGARDPARRLLLDATQPRVYFGTGSETNQVLEAEMVDFAATDGSGRSCTRPVFTPQQGSVARLCDSARLCNELEHVDFFIRNVNIQDPGITEANKDVNVFLASLLYMTKHVQAGLSSIAALDDVLTMAEIIAGGPEALKANPLVSFIACLVKSPLQMVEDTTDKVFAICGKGMPLVVSSSPQGGSTAPIQEEGMVAQINAEILAGVTLSQLINRGTPVLYGAVPVRARLDTLHDLYGAPEFIHYNIDCIQMARRYGLPCYSTAGVGDHAAPGMQVAVEKLFSHLAIAQAGAQYVHYAFGLLDRTNLFCPLQAVIDNANVGMVKQIIREPVFDTAAVDGAVGEVRKVMKSGSRLYARQIRKYRRLGLVSPPYPLESEGEDDAVFAKAAERLAAIRAGDGERLDAQTEATIRDRVPGLLPADHFQP
ncbi:MAG: trimethylamine methyltransferase family protein [Planctomycetota bacterium]